MKTLFLSILGLLFFINISFAQIVDIPDAAFKYILVNIDCADFDNDGVYESDVDINNDGEVQISEAQAVYRLNLFHDTGITDLTGISSFSNLRELIVTYVDLSVNSLDISGLPFLEKLVCFNTQISALDTSNNPELKSLNCQHNNIAYLDLSLNLNLEMLWCNHNLITELDLSNNNQLQSLTSGNLGFEYLNIKNNAVTNFYNFHLSNPIYICADEGDLELLENSSLPYNTVINSYCSFTPGGEYFTIEGENRVDVNANGCNADDNFYTNLKFNITDGNNSGVFIADNTGYYNIPVSEGTHTLTPVLENPNYFNVTPSSVTISFPTDGDPFTQDFCMTMNGVNNDLYVILVPATGAVPGFDAMYKIIYKNNGNTTLSGIINLDFDDDYMDFLSASPTEGIEALGNLEWNYTDLQPYETREINVNFNLNTPTDPNFPLNSDDILSFNVSINPIVNDETPEDNAFELEQTVVNSYDPNDIRCLEGANILPEQVGEYVHYLIRFENLGTANAINVVVKDVIDTSKFDVSTLIPLNASHDFVTRIKEGNIVEFIFEDIQLPFDDANNDGYVLFKIKTLNTLVLNDTFENEAEIYFDFNFPIITNNYSTEVAEDNLNIDDYDLSKIRLFPNPAKNELTIVSDSRLDKIKIIDINGRLVLSKIVEESVLEQSIDIQDLTSSLYFIEVQSNNRMKILKFIKQ